MICLARGLATWALLGTRALLEFFGGIIFSLYTDCNPEERLPPFFPFVFFSNTQIFINRFPGQFAFRFPPLFFFAKCLSLLTSCPSFSNSWHSFRFRSYYPYVCAFLTAAKPFPSTALGGCNAPTSLPTGMLSPHQCRLGSLCARPLLHSIRRAPTTKEPRRDAITWSNLRTVCWDHLDDYTCSRRPVSKNPALVFFRQMPTAVPQQRAALRTQRFDSREIFLGLCVQCRHPIPVVSRILFPSFPSSPSFVDPCCSSRLLDRISRFLTVCLPPPHPTPTTFSCFPHVPVSCHWAHRAIGASK